MKQPSGYPLPSGDLGSDDIACQLVYLPDRPEYWQALLGALSYLATWKAWERDVDKRGKDAAANWREALECTLECWRMTCLDDLKDNVAEILAIMQLGNSCCAEQDPTDGDQYTDRVDDGEGDVPQNIIDAGYAEDSEDWDGFDDYKCMIAHVLIDEMETRLRHFDDLLNEYGAIVGGAAAVAAVLAFAASGGGLLIIAGMLTGIGVVSFLYSSIMEFGALNGLADDVSDNHDLLACAVYWADGDESALIALNDKIDQIFSATESLILKNLNMGTFLKSLYAGRYDQQDIAQNLDDAGYEVGDFNCDCDVQLGEYSITFTFLTDDDDWVNGAFWINQGHPDAGAMYFAADNGYMSASFQLLAAVAGCPVGTNKITINRIRFHHMRTNSTAGSMVLMMKHGPTDDYDTIYYDGSDAPTWTTENEVFPTGYDLIINGIAARFMGSGSANWQWLDTVTFEFDAEIV